MLYIGSACYKIHGHNTVSDTVYALVLPNEMHVYVTKKLRSCPTSVSSERLFCSQVKLVSCLSQVSSKTCDSICLEDAGLSHSLT